MKILIVDNNIDKPWGYCGDFRRYLEGQVLVRRAPEKDLPPSPRGFSHIIVSGSKTSCLDSSDWVKILIEFVQNAVNYEIPLLGVCYGHQILARAFGGDNAVGKSKTPEIGWVKVTQTEKNPILEGLPKNFYTFQSHVEEVVELPIQFVSTASSDRCQIQAYYMKDKPAFGVQFHPERNAQEGQMTIDKRKKVVPKDYIFGNRKANLLFTENIARTIFRNFLK